MLTSNSFEMMKTTNVFSLTLLFVASLFVACTGDLEQNPLDPDSFTEVQVYADADEAKKALAKVYGSLVTGGQDIGNGDIAGIDSNFSQFSRMLLNLNEVPTDNVVVGWGDPGLPDLNTMNWSSENSFTQAMYYRLGQMVSFANSFITNAQPLSADPEVQAFIAEARFIRAYAYYNLMDLYANVPLVTEVSDVLPSQSGRPEIFGFIETELKELEGLLKASNEYGRVDVVAAQALLTRLYLNAEVYTGIARYSDVVTYADKVLNSSAYSLHDNYEELFMADNDENGAQRENIFVLPFDGINTITYGGTTFINHAFTGGNMNAADRGINNGWGGYRSTSALVDKFGGENPASWNDDRALFFTDGQQYNQTDLANFKHGYAITKVSNKRSDGQPARDTSGEHADTDLPLIRVGEIHLNRVEANFRNGNTAEALSEINALRARSNAPALGVLTLETILDERARELYMEGVRRTDLVRFGKFTGGDYVWPFKGGAASGTSISDIYAIYPLPSQVLLVNPNLQQNTGY
jgi:starch-binding outer membrane protein, SusD/RagB family